MQVVHQQPVTAINAAPSTLVGLGARIEVPVSRAIVSAFRWASIDPDTGAWTVTLDAPPALGTYNLVWRTDDAEPPDYEVFIPLEVIAAVVTPVTPVQFSPTVQEVAYVTPAYTRGGFDDDGLQGGAEQGSYDASTSPTATHVEALIAAGAEEVAGRVGVLIPAHLAGLAKRAVVWHVAAAIAAGKMPAGTDEAGGEYRAYVANYTGCLNELVTLAREPNATRLV